MVGNWLSDALIDADDGNEPADALDDDESWLRLPVAADALELEIEVDDELDADAVAVAEEEEEEEVKEVAEEEVSTQAGVRTWDLPNEMNAVSRSATAGFNS